MSTSTLSPRDPGWRYEDEDAPHAGRASQYQPYLAGFMIVGTTSSKGRTVNYSSWSATSLTQTDSGWSDPALSAGQDTDGMSPPAAAAPAELSDKQTVRQVHDESGLTWDQLARIFGVSRRAVHHWAAGGRMNAAHAEMLRELAAMVSSLPAADPDGRRAALLAGGEEGSIVNRLIARHRTSPLDVSGTPWAPDQLLGAQHGDATR